MTSEQHACRLWPEDPTQPDDETTCHVCGKKWVSRYVIDTEGGDVLINAGLVGSSSLCWETT